MEILIKWNHGVIDCMPRKVTLRDVAELANVAIGTASQALNGKGSVLPETRERVIQVARQLGYDQRFQFSETVRAKPGTVGVIKHDSYDRPGLDPFYFPVICGVERECRENSLSMIYTTIEVDENNRAIRLNSDLTRSHFDGLLVIGAYLNRDMIRDVGATQCPVVLVDGYAEINRWDRVLMNNGDGAYRAVSYLIEQGHRHIGLIASSTTSYPSVVERREGYLRAIHEHRLPDGYIVDGLLKRDTAHHDTIDLLKKHPQITALFICNDNSAIGAYSGIRELGLSVPEDISVIGFDDIAFSQDMVPALTTMHVDKMEMGKVALRQLLYSLQNNDAPISTTLLDTALTIRKSVQSVKE